MMPAPCWCRTIWLGSQTEQYSDQPVGTVISQNPAAGSTTKLNGRVNIVVSAGPEPAPEPEAPSDSTTGGDWWSGLFGSGSSSSSTETAPNRAQRAAATLRRNR